MTWNVQLQRPKAWSTRTPSDAAFATNLMPPALWICCT